MKDAASFSGERVSFELEEELRRKLVIKGEKQLNQQERQLLLQEIVTFIAHKEHHHHFV